MGNAYRASEFELFVIEHLDLPDTNFSKDESGQYVDKMTTCLQILWEQSWANGYDLGYDNGSRDGRIEEHDRSVFRYAYS